MFITNKVRIYFSSDRRLAQSIKNIFGFVPGNIFLYQLACRHRSAANETINGYRLSNERLEYLGDAILNAVIADYLFKKFPYKNEGFLTEMRSRIVSRNSLNRLSQKLGLDQWIHLHGEHKNTFRSANGDAFEAFIGAIYIDKGYQFTRNIVIRRIIDVHIDIDTLQKSEFNFKSKLLEWGQKEKRSIEFIVAAEIGEGYKKQYLIEVHVDGENISEAKDFSIKGAEQLAAEKAWPAVMSENS
ncbi:MAG: ribonuclease III [Bacteroidales bacterium]|nr:ribonuclease III [Bacteroidales bacterium]MDD3701281.1 ribonuclease III [Bacteroidales bacterium]MDY0368410.1 ribonuclease III [Bacteroidales bacterium]